jgi:hypothetical protein
MEIGNYVDVVGIMVREKLFKNSIGIDKQNMREC